MPRPEKTVFISYRRKDISWALAVYHYLTKHDYDVFFDYKSIPSGDFEQIIVGNIKARAHFLVILTPTALDRANEPGDWLRREIENAISERRNIIPLFFDGFNFGAPSVSEKLTGKLGSLKRYNGLEVPAGYFDEAMERLRSRYLNVTLDAVLHPVSEEVQKAVKEQQVAANLAISGKEEIEEKARKEKEEHEKKEVEKRAHVAAELKAKKEQEEKERRLAEEKARREEKRQARNAAFERIRKRIVESLSGVLVEGKKLFQNINPKQYGIGGVIVLVLLIFFYGGNYIAQNFPTSNVPIEMNTPSTTPFVSPTITPTSISTLTPTENPTATPTETPQPTPTIGFGSMISPKDGMVMVYVPAGEFKMGNDDGDEDEKPVHTVYLDVFWMDQTEVTNEQFALFLNAEENQDVGDKLWASVSAMESDGNPIKNVDGTWQVDSDLGNHPMAYVSWEGAQAYCEWAGRRLPTEAEWEKAARGNLEGKYYPWGDNPPVCEMGAENGAQYGRCSGGTVPVGSFAQNGYGLYDMAGNVMEWVADMYDPDFYANSPVNHPFHIKSPFSVNSDFPFDLHVLRGGAFDSLHSYFKEFLRVSNRHMEDGATQQNTLGFRCAMDATE